MKIKPILTEKSLMLAGDGKYTFMVDSNMTKYQIKDLVEEMFEVTVVRVRTMNTKGEVKKTIRGRKKYIKPYKKAIAYLKSGDKIDLFGEKNKK